VLSAVKVAQRYGAGTQRIKTNMKYLLLIISLSGLSACYQDSDVVFHQAGVYKGQVDLHNVTAADHEALLAARFNQVQTDR